MTLHLREINVKTYLSVRRSAFDAFQTRSEGGMRDRLSYDTPSLLAPWILVHRTQWMHGILRTSHVEALDRSACSGHQDTVRGGITRIWFRNRGRACSTAWRLRVGGHSAGSAL